MIPQPGGAYLLKPGKPVQWADTSQAAKHLNGIHPSTLRNWIQSGVLPARLPDGTEVFRKRTPKLWEFNLPAVEEVRRGWKKDALA